MPVLPNTPSLSPFELFLTAELSTFPDGLWMGMMEPKTPKTVEPKTPKIVVPKIPMGIFDPNKVVPKSRVVMPKTPKATVVVSKQKITDLQMKEFMLGGSALTKKGRAALSNFITTLALIVPRFEIPSKFRFNEPTKRRITTDLIEYMYRHGILAYKTRRDQAVNIIKSVLRGDVPSLFREAMEHVMELLNTSFVVKGGWMDVDFD